MNSFVYERKNSDNPMFSEEEFRELLSDDFNLVKLYTDDQGMVTTFIVIHKDHPEVIDSISKGLEFSFNGSDYYLPNTYSFDPRMLSEKQFETFVDDINNDLCIDLELDMLDS